MPATTTLSQSLTLPCGVKVKNRLLKSAMSEALATRDGAATPELVRLYGAWAAGGIGLCITGNVMIDKRAKGEPGNVIIEGPQHLKELQAWAKAATANKTQCWVQLNHPGKQAPKGLNRENVAPSAIPFRKDMQAFFPTPRELTADEVQALVDRFALAAKTVKDAGFTGVQIHGAHGYLVSQFLSPHHNQRTDAWGGTPEKRRRFVLEVYRAIREAVGSKFPVGIKLNSADFQRGGFTEEESLDTIRALAAAGIDLIEISGGTYEAPAMTGVKTSKEPVKESTKAREAYFLEFAEKARAAVDTPLVVTGGFRTAKGMAQAIDSGAVDMVGIARIMAVEPDVPNRLLAGKNPEQVVRPIRTGISAIDKMGLLEISWYTGQLKRIGRGQPTKPKEPGLWVFAKQVWGMMGVGKKKRKPTKLRAT
ncbi:NADH:flavin oxidoreductase/NADH oxidase family protein [Curvibacter sp. APW13]|uniref:NADH:flavin oxidoreductase/NADH oxidase family protein n=1 Tax=Curvibacter sp. APW13 TaxID=3077236 RepID=UPI0028E029D4|nr:NADH:flavin oxidoreductase/NADH oxidase family protein [Curvibacter sp. APW13]MDT8991753.1 NADH:flavin oxidoreductase/NADH oxidase family protein [Curvibacter sp. APW13]